MERTLAITLLIGCFVVVAAVDSPDYHADMSVKPSIETRQLTGKEARLAEYFAKAGSDMPIEVAQTIISTAKRPRLMSAIAKVETQGRNVRGKNGEVGVWQVMPEYHGPVDPHNLAEQLRQSEAILDELLEQTGGSLRGAVQAYNGSGPAAVRYSMKVMREIREVPL